MQRDLVNFQQGEFPIKLPPNQYVNPNSIHLFLINIKHDIIGSKRLRLGDCSRSWIMSCVDLNVHEV